ncbi:MAG: hypothetical protein PWP70_1438 [Moorella sp. (in: firmicutes)]|nr:hypothetical protein [Moorella sp. (in: firmicutes)]
MTATPVLVVGQEWLPEGLILTLRGEITAAVADIFAALLELDPWPEAILLDFSAVDYINSAGIAQLIKLLRQVRTRGGVLRARGLSGHYQKIFRMVGLTEYITVLV